MQSHLRLMLLSLVSLLVAAILAYGQPASALGGGCGPSGIRGLFINYCQSAELAKVAREFGMNVRAEEVHNNKLLRVEICQFVGHDIRIQHLCTAYVPK